MYPDAYLAYLVHFHGDRDYFECHEVLEEYWKSMPAPSREPVWVGLIQVAAALYHQRRENFAGARKLMQSALCILRREASRVEALGLDGTRLFPLLAARLADIEQRVPYQSLDLPIRDPALLDRCRLRCQELGVTFGRPSDLSNAFLLHKHTLRDRREVIAERERSLRQKRDGRTPGP